MLDKELAQDILGKAMEQVLAKLQVLAIVQVLE
jgi:hypothetical protein